MYVDRVEGLWAVGELVAMRYTVGPLRAWLLGRLLLQTVEYEQRLNPAV